MDVKEIIYDKGCIQAGEELMEENLILVSTLIIVCLFFEVNFNFNYFSIVFKQILNLNFVIKNFEKFDFFAIFQFYKLKLNFILKISSLNFIFKNFKFDFYF